MAAMSWAVTTDATAGARRSNCWLPVAMVTLLFVPVYQREFVFFTDLGHGSVCLK